MVNYRAKMKVWPPVTANQILIGRTSTVPVRDYDPEDSENLSRRDRYQSELLQTWWNQYYQQVFQNLLPFQKWKDSKRHNNLQVRDVCLIKYDSKVKGTYRLCRVHEVRPDADGVVRSVSVQLRPRDRREPSLPYKPKTPMIMETGVQRLVMICPQEEQTDSVSTK